MNKKLLFLANHRRLYGGLLLIPLLFLAAPSVISYLIGIPIMLAGWAFRIWSSGFIFKDNTLATVGPYSMVRNPLYFGSYIMGAGVFIAAGSWLMFIFYIVSFPVVYYAVILLEEDRLRGLFGEEYVEYCSDVPRLLPYPWKYRSAGVKWSAGLTFGEHKEWVAGTASFVVLIALVILNAINSEPPAAAPQSDTSQPVLEQSAAPEEAQQSEEKTAE